MKRGGLFLAIIFLMLIPNIVLASITFESSATQLTGLTPNLGNAYPNPKYSAFYFNGSWYIGFTSSGGAGHNISFSRWDLNFNDRLDGWDELAGCTYGDCVIDYYNLTDGIIWQSFSPIDKRFNSFAYTDLSTTLEWTNTDNYNGVSGSTADVDISGAGDIAVLRTPNNQERYWNFDSSTSATLYFSGTYDGHVNGLDILYDGERYYLFFIYNSGVTETPFANIYLGKEFTLANYNGTQSLGLGSESNISDLSSAFRTGIGDYYLAYNLNNSQAYPNSPANKVRINRYVRTSINSLAYVESQDLQPPNVDNIVNTTVSPFLYYSSDLSKFYLFYSVHNMTDGTYISSYVLEEDNCVCGDWVNTTDCIGNLIKRERVCSPNNCLPEEEYNASTICELEQNHTLGIFEQKYTNYISYEDCETDFFEPPTKITCDFKKEIPSNCVNITATVYNKPVFRTRLTSLCSNTGNYTLEVCNPDKTDECTSSITSCDNINSTLDKTYSSFIAGEIATASSSLETDNICQCYDFWLTSIGIDSYSLKSQFKIECNIPFEDTWICDGLYERHQQIDGTYIEENNCGVSGCNNETGRCYSNQISNPVTPYGFTYWVRFAIQPNDTQKTYHSFIWSSVIGMALAGFISGKSKSGDASSLVILFLVGFSCGLVGFAVIDWLSWWILIIIGIFGLGGIALKMLK